MIPPPRREPPSKARFRALARECGFELAGVAAAQPHADFALYREWANDGRAGPLGYLTDHRMGVRGDPRELLASAQSILCVGMLYNTAAPARLHDDDGAAGRISRYAWGAGDYHNVLRARLERLVERLRETWGKFDARICVDTAPLLERSYARAAGLGWIGKNTCLINQPLGSWFFLGEILVSVELPPDAPPPDRCGSCTRCIDACPTQALIPAPGVANLEIGAPPPPDWQLDAALCISTLTIEQRGATPAALRAPTGAHLFGCDICQEVCPWNRRAPFSSETAFHPVHADLGLETMAALTADEFRERFRATPVWRSRYAGWLRNVATALGNSGQARFIEPLLRLAASGDSGVAEHARWALQRIHGSEPKTRENGPE